MRFWPCFGDGFDSNRVDHDDHGGCAARQGFDVSINAQAAINGAAFDACFFPRFGRRSIGGCHFVHRPTFGQYPPFGTAAGNDANLKFVVLDAVAKGRELCAHVCLAACVQFQWQLPFAFFGQVVESFDRVHRPMCRPRKQAPRGVLHGGGAGRIVGG